MLTYKFPLFPNSVQQDTLWDHSLALNKLYNHFLEVEKQAHVAKQPFLNNYALNNLIPKLRQEMVVYSGIHAQALQHVSYRVATSYNLFFKHVTIHPPKFRSCSQFFNIFYPQLDNGYHLIGNIFHTKQYGDIRFYAYREMVGTVKTVSITHDDIRNKWYLCICTDGKRYPTKFTNKHIGIDLGITNLVTTSDGETIKGPVTHTKYFDKQINKLKARRDAKHKVGSRRFKKLSKVVRKLYAVKNHKTKDVLHKISNDLSKRFDTIIVEDLNTKKMTEGKIHGLNREMRNVGIGMFLDFLAYKSYKVVRVNPFDTSKTCCKCGHVHEKMPLSKRKWTCPVCETILDRDRNAALNVLHLGRAKLSRFYGHFTELTIHDIHPSIWMDEQLYTAKELAVA